MPSKAVRERQKQVQSFKVLYEKALQLREFLLSEREIVIELLKKSLDTQDKERIDNLRTRIQEKERQLHLVEDELEKIRIQLAGAERRLQNARARGAKEKE
jgi:hypothetical protein